ncbi:MAG: aspartyl beta-hydroxylase, partial [Steroidobacteraceae bacterium]
MSAPRDEARAEALRLFRSGHVLEAEQACLLRLETDPDDIEALKVVAVAALRRSDAVRAIARLTRATTLDPADTIARYHLARAHELAGNTIAALAWYDTALQLDPGFHVARLNYGAALERAGEGERALWQWARALRDAQSLGRWHDAATTPSGLAPLVERAVGAVRARRRAMLAGVVVPFEARHGPEGLARVRHALDLFLGDAVAANSDPRQQPSFLWFPGLPAAPLPDRS